jgi:hypothetical protein
MCLILHLESYSFASPFKLLVITLLSTVSLFHLLHLARYACIELGNYSQALGYAVMYLVPAYPSAKLNTLKRT